MTGEEYLQHIQEREYERVAGKPRDIDTLIREHPDRLAEFLLKKQRPKSPLEQALPRAQAYASIKSFAGTKLPTPYENPIAYSIMTRLTADIEESAETIFGWKYENRPTLGTLPLGTVDASATHIPFTEKFVIVFQENIFVFISLLAKVVAAAIPADGSVEPAEFSYSVDGIDKKIATNPIIRERFSDVLASYLLEGRPHANGQYVLVQPSQLYAEILIQGAE
jgi:hypothetical protein